MIPIRPESCPNCGEELDFSRMPITYRRGRIIEHCPECGVEVPSETDEESE